MSQPLRVCIVLGCAFGLLSPQPGSSAPPEIRHTHIDKPADANPLLARFIIEVGKWALGYAAGKVADRYLDEYRGRQTIIRYIDIIQQDIAGESGREIAELRRWLTDIENILKDNTKNLAEAQAEIRELRTDLTSHIERFEDVVLEMTQRADAFEKRLERLEANKEEVDRQLELLRLSNARTNTKLDEISREMEQLTDWARSTTHFQLHVSAAGGLLQSNENTTGSEFQGGYMLSLEAQPDEVFGFWLDYMKSSARTLDFSQPGAVADSTGPSYELLRGGMFVTTTRRRPGLGLKAFVGAAFLTETEKAGLAGGLELSFEHARRSTSALEFFVSGSYTWVRDVPNRSIFETSDFVLLDVRLGYRIKFWPHQPYPRFFPKS